MASNKCRRNKRIRKSSFGQYQNKKWKSSTKRVGEKDKVNVKCYHLG